VLGAAAERPREGRDGRMGEHVADDLRPATQGLRGQKGLLALRTL
jgi:hypothetical protein